jgi:hypothetical protein
MVVVAAIAISAPLFLVLGSSTVPRPFDKKCRIPYISVHRILSTKKRVFLQREITFLRDTTLFIFCILGNNYDEIIMTL